MENEVRLLLKNNLYEDVLKITESDVNFNNFKNKTVLVTGAGELLGYYLCLALLASNDLYATGIKVIAADRSDGIFKSYGKLTYREDIDFIVGENYSNLTTVKADYFIHTDIPESDKEITSVLEFIKENKAHSVICFDSSIYGDVFNGRDKISETDTGYCDSFNPESTAVQLQRIFESTALGMADEFGLDIKSARICRVYGALRSKYNRDFIKTVNCVIEKSNIEIGEKDGNLESFIYVTDAAAAVLKILIEANSGEIFNAASTNAASTHIIAQYCVKLFENLKIEIIYKKTPKGLSPMAPTVKVLDTTRLEKLGFRPSVELKDGIVMTAKILYEMKD